MCWPRCCELSDNIDGYGDGSFFWLRDSRFDYFLAVAPMVLQVATGFITLLFNAFAVGNRANDLLKSLLSGLCIFRGRVMRVFRLRQLRAV
jgi:hypothetical protein